MGQDGTGRGRRARTLRGVSRGPESPARRARGGTRHRRRSRPWWRLGARRWRRRGPPGRCIRPRMDTQRATLSGRSSDAQREEIEKGVTLLRGAPRRERERGAVAFAQGQGHGSVAMARAVSTERNGHASGGFVEEGVEQYAGPSGLSGRQCEGIDRAKEGLDEPAPALVL